MSNPFNHSIDRLSSDLFWPVERLYQALQAVATAAGLPLVDGQRQVDFGPEEAIFEDRTRLDQWVRAAGRAIQIAAQPVNFALGRIAATLEEGAPVVIHVNIASETAPPAFLAIVAIEGERAKLVDTREKIRIVSLQAIVDRCLGEDGHKEREKLTTSLAYVLPKIEPAVVNRVLADRFEQRWVAYGWRIQLPAAAPFRHTVRHHRLPRSAVGFTVSHALVHLLWVFSWFLLGRAIFQGSFDPVWFLTWALVRLSIIPLRAINGWFQGHFSIALGGILKRRLLGGAFNIDSDLIKTEGVGHLVGRVLESEVLENLLLQGGFLLLAGVIETVVALWLLSQTTAPAAYIGLLIAWLLLLIGICTGYGIARERWTVDRLQLTHSLTEKMTGHKTRLAQLPPAAWHTFEDEELADYGRSVLQMDRWFVWLRPLVVNGWLLAGAVVFFLTMGRITARPVLLALTIGAILATALAFSKLVQGVSQLIDAWIATRQISHFLQREPPQPPPLARSAASPRAPLLTTHQLTFRYRPQGPDIINGLDLNIFPRDRVLLESRSGGGKSTLVALLSGLRQPRSGLVLLDGLDIRTHGLENWRKQIAIAPQFHENYIFLGTMAFNLLMGRRWPPTLDDLAEAERLCNDIGLQPLLDRMPSGLQQMVGETGWQLSHGERTRVYLARALLQKAPLTILDESFGALDPVTLQQVMITARAQDTALVVIAHP